MKKTFILCLSLFFGLTMSAGSTKRAKSPNGELAMKQTDGQYVVEYQGKPVLRIEAQGYATDASVENKSRLDFVRHLTTDYTMLSGKRLHCINEANEYAVDLNKGTRLVWRLYNDGVAFRYELTG